MNTQMYAFALRKTTANHIRGCVVKILYPTLPRFQSKMAIVWDRSILATSAAFADDDDSSLPDLSTPIDREVQRCELLLPLHTSALHGPEI